MSAEAGISEDPKETPELSTEEYLKGLTDWEVINLPEAK